MGTPDFLSFASAAATGFASAAATGFAEGVIPIFACSTASDEGCGSVAITADAVFLGEEDGIVRLETAQIRRWSADGRGSLFTLTVECGGPHITSLFSRFRTATVTAMTSAVGPERVLLRAA